MSRKLLIAVVGVGLFGAHAALAAPPDDRPLTIIVRFADLDVSRDAGAATLYARIRSAADRVCAPLESRLLGERARRSDCIDRAVAEAVADVAAPRLTQLHERATGRDGTRRTQVAASR